MAPKTDTTQDTTLAIHERKAKRTECAAAIREGLELEVRGALMVGRGLNDGQDTFLAAELDEFWTWATTVTRKSKKTCQSYMAVAAANSSLTTKAAADKAATFTFEQGQVLASTPTELRKEFVKRMTKDTTPTDARELRDSLVAETLTDEDKKAAEKKAAEKKTREREQAAEKTTKLADDIRTGVKKAVQSGDIWKAMSFAAQLVNGGRTGEQVSEAIVRIQSDVAATERAIAEKAEKLAKAEKAAAILVESRKS